MRRAGSTLTTLVVVNSEINLSVFHELFDDILSFPLSVDVFKFEVLRLPA